MKIKNNYYLLLFFAAHLIISGCSNSESGTPKPRLYPRVDFPERKYHVFNACNFEFEYPDYAEIKKEKTYFDTDAPNDCWYNLFFKSYNDTLYLTYYPFNNKNEFEKLIEDSYDLVSKHDVKASGRKEIPVKLKTAGGMLFKIEGNVASHTQFFLTDSTRNFIRGSLYFNNKVNTDSMQVIQDFIDEDIEHLIHSFKWTK